MGIAPVVYYTEVFAGITSKQLEAPLSAFFNELP
jgi:hypothetical protein